MIKKLDFNNIINLCYIKKKNKIMKRNKSDWKKILQKTHLKRNIF